MSGGVTMVGCRHADVRNKFSLPPHLRLANFTDVTASSGVASTSDSGLAAYVASQVTCGAKDANCNHVSSWIVRHTYRQALAVYREGLTQVHV